MEQLPLSFVPRIPYGENNFILHEGVASLVSLLEVELLADRFSINFITGQSRFGKSHLALTVFELAKAKKLAANLVLGDDMFNWTKQRMSKSAFGSKEVLVVDDADVFLSEFGKGQSGLFVNLVETLRTKHASLVLLSTKGLDDFQADEHVMSRLLAGQQLEIAVPSEEDLPELIAGLAHQYGFELSERCVDYLAKRLTRSIPGIEAFIQKLVKESQATSSPVGLKLVSEVFESQ